MGNCQAAEAAAVVIQHPNNKVQRIYSSVSAHQVMSSNPGHYVALVMSSSTVFTENGTPVCKAAQDSPSTRYFANRKSLSPRKLPRYIL